MVVIAHKYRSDFPRSKIFIEEDIQASLKARWLGPGNYLEIWAAQLVNNPKFPSIWRKIKVVDGRTNKIVVSLINKYREYGRRIY